jgi:hypothetical protein
MNGWQMMTLPILLLGSALRADIEAGLINPEMDLTAYLLDAVRPDREITELLTSYTNEARIVGKTDAALFGNELSSGPMEVLDAIQKETDLFAPGGPGTRPRDEALYRQPNRPAAQSRSGQTRAPLDTSQIPEQAYIDGAQSEGSIAAKNQGLADMRAAIKAGDDFELTLPDGQTYRASEILDDLEADANVAEIINLCNPKGGA